MDALDFVYMYLCVVALRPCIKAQRAPPCSITYVKREFVNPQDSGRTGGNVLPYA